MSQESFNTPEKVEQKPKSPFGDQYGGIKESEKFPDTKIISFKDGDKVKHYALSRDGSGNLSGAEFELQEYSIPPGTNGDGYWKNSMSNIDTEGSFIVGGKNIPKYRTGPTYQMKGSELDAMQEYLEEKGISV